MQVQCWCSEKDSPSKFYYTSSSTRFLMTLVPRKLEDTLSENVT